MEKKVKDVFLNCNNINNDFCNADIEEIKFSKKLNAVILNAKSDLNIALSDIEEFENQAKNAYSLNSFKVNYTYVGDTYTVEEKDIKECISMVNKKFDYTQDIFENCKIDINNDENSVNITIKKPLANFMIMQKIDKYIAKQIKTKFGNDIEIIIKDDKNNTETDVTNYNMVKIEDLANIPSNSIGVVSKSKKKAEQNTFVKRPPLTKEEKEDRKRAKFEQPEYVIYGVDILTDKRERVIDVNENQERVCIDGYIFERESKETKKGKIIFTIDV